MEMKINQLEDGTVIQTSQFDNGCCDYILWLKDKNKLYVVLAFDNDGRIKLDAANEARL